MTGRMALAMAPAMADRMAELMRLGWQNDAPNPNPNPNPTFLFACDCFSSISNSIHRYGSRATGCDAWMAADAAIGGGQ